MATEYDDGDDDDDDDNGDHADDDDDDDGDADDDDDNNDNGDDFSTFRLLHSASWRSQGEWELKHATQPHGHTVLAGRNHKTPGPHRADASLGRLAGGGPGPCCPPQTPGGAATGAPSAGG